MFKRKFSAKGGYVCLARLSDEGFIEILLNLDVHFTSQEFDVSYRIEVIDRRVECTLGMKTDCRSIGQCHLDIRIRSIKEKIFISGNNHINMLILLVVELEDG